MQGEDNAAMAPGGGPSGSSEAHMERERHAEGHTQPQPLRLKLTHSHGRSADGVLDLPATGTGLAQALALGGERLNAAQWEDAERCRIAWQGPEEGWRLSHGGRAMVCVLNGGRVAARASLPLAVGDVLELGWQRFDVQAAGGAPTRIGRAPGAASAATPEATRLPGCSARSEGTTFDLRDLASQPDAAAGQGDPFGALGIPGAEQRPAGDPLAELLGEAPRRTVSPRTPDQAPQTGQLGVFESLHEEFHCVVRDPAQLSGRADWDDADVPSSDHATSIEELHRLAAAYPLLRDILQRREHIDQTIRDFHPLARPTLLDIDEPEDVLRLFAPSQGDGVSTAVPSLTRREHHDLSPDSHLRLHAFQPEAKKEPPR
ncbi:TagK domain-containing protein [Rhodoferax koreensis]|nr:TagK domain-containing protein [Rhodoferax koreense]